VRAALAVCLVVAAVPAVALGAGSRERSLTRARGDVSATLFAGAGSRGIAHITIRVDGRVVKVARLRDPGCGICPIVVDDSTLLSIRDVDADGRADVVVLAWNGGNECCSAAFVFRRVGPSRFVPMAQHMALGAALRDLGANGGTEFASDDERFRGLFTSNAMSTEPIQIFRVGPERFEDVTRRYPRTVARAAAFLDDFLSRTRGAGDLRGIFAAWAADEELLGNDALVWERAATLERRHQLRGIGWLSNAAYLTKLRRALRAFGYLR
jgi:hypothetical protein